MRRIVLTLLFALGASAAHAEQWDNLAIISSTLGNTANQLCIGLTLGEIGCPTYAPTVLSNGNVGIGTASPTANLDVYGANISTVGRVVNASSTAARFPGMVVENYSGSTGAAKWGSPIYYLRASAGSKDAPLPISSGYSLGSLMFYGQNATTPNSWNRGASIAAFAQENYTSTAGGTYLTVATANTGATLSSEKMRITADGNVGIGITSPTANLEVSGTISATNLLVNGLPVTGGGAVGDRITSGTAFVKAVQDAGAEVSGTLKLTSTGSEVCGPGKYYTMRINPVTQRVQMCRP